MDFEQIMKDFDDWHNTCAYPSAFAAWKAAHTHYAKSAAPVVLPPHPDTARLQHAAWRLEDILKTMTHRHGKRLASFRASKERAKTRT